MIKNRIKQKENVKTAKGRRISSTKWLERHINDPYVQMAKGKYRSRAAFKLLQIDEKFHLLNRASSVIDLGCAPGGWLQVLKAKCNKTTMIVGVDLQKVQPVPGVTIIEGDFFDDACIDQILVSRDVNFDLIVSDLAASSCGTPEVDHLKSVALIEAVMMFAMDRLLVGGNLVAKAIRGGQEQLTTKRLKMIFKEVKQFKPDASYSGSAEFFYICLGHIKGVDPFS